MALYTLIVTSSPVVGKEQEYNDWYDRHIRDVLTTSGVKTGRRLKVCTSHEIDQPYMALYDIETDDPDAFVAMLWARVDAGEIPTSDTLGSATVTMYENIGTMQRCEASTIG